MRRLALIVLLLLCALPPARAANADDLLEPDKAFRFSALALDAATVEVRYAIADGYYLYRERFRFAAEPASVTLGPPQFPKGQVHEDKFFGKQEIYRKAGVCALPCGRFPVCRRTCPRGPAPSETEAGRVSPRTSSSANRKSTARKCAYACRSR